MVGQLKEPVDQTTGSSCWRTSTSNVNRVAKIRGRFRFRIRRFPERVLTTSTGQMALRKTSSATLPVRNRPGPSSHECPSRCRYRWASGRRLRLQRAFAAQHLADLLVIGEFKAARVVLAAAANTRDVVSLREIDPDPHSTPRFRDENPRRRSIRPRRRLRRHGSAVGSACSFRGLPRTPRLMAQAPGMVWRSTMPVEAIKYGHEVAVQQQRHRHAADHDDGQRLGRLAAVATRGPAGRLSVPPPR